MSNHWKPAPNSLAAVRVKDVGLADWPTILAADGRYSRIPPGFLMPLPGPSPEDAAVLRAAEDFGACKRGSAATLEAAIAARNAARFAAAQSPAPSPATDVDAQPAETFKVGDRVWDFSNPIPLCGKINGAAPHVPSFYVEWDDGNWTWVESKWLRHAPHPTCAEDARIAGLRDAVVAAAMEQARMGVAPSKDFDYACACLATNKAADTYRAALSPPPPPDPAEEIQAVAWHFCNTEPYSGRPSDDAMRARGQAALSAMKRAAVAALKEADNAQ